MNEEQKEKLTAIIGIRVYPSYKKVLQEVATAGGQTLTDFIYDLIEAGSEKMEKMGEDVKQGSEKP